MQSASQCLCEAVRCIAVSWACGLACLLSLPAERSLGTEGIASVACKKKVWKWKRKKVFVTGKSVGQSCEQGKVGLLCFHSLRSLQPYNLS